jgi:hypothetical protein
MSSAPPFEFEIEYDEASLRAAGHSLFLQNQRRLMWFSLGTVFCFVVIGSLSWWIRSSEMLWVPIGLIAFQIVLLPFSRWSVTHRLLKTMLGTTARFRWDVDAFSMESEAGSHTLPWWRFQFTRRDPRNVLFFLTGRSALIVPTTGTSNLALEYAIERVAAARKAV